MPNFFLVWHRVVSPDGTNFGQYLVAEDDIFAIQDHLKLIDGGRTEDRRHWIRPLTSERQSEMHRMQTVAFGEVDVDLGNVDRTIGTAAPSSGDSVIREPSGMAPPVYLPVNKPVASGE